MSGSSPSSGATRWWIDALFIGGGAVALSRGWPGLGGALFLFGLAFPVLRAVGRRGRSVEHALRFAPAEIACEHQRVLRAASALPEEPTASRAVDGADDVVLEAAAIFAGRPARGAVHRRYVRQRCEMLQDVARSLEDRSSAVAAARAELDLLDGVDIAPLEPGRASDRLGTILLWLLAPLFIVWEVGAAAGRAVCALADGVALRLRTLLRLLGRALAASGRAIVATARKWRDARVRLVASWSEARRRFTAARFRWRLRIRRVRRAL